MLFDCLWVYTGFDSPFLTPPRPSYLEISLVDRQDTEMTVMGILQCEEPTKHPTATLGVVECYIRRDRHH